MTNLISDLAALQKNASRARRGQRSHASGLQAEAAACAALRGDGWTILGQRLRTPAGEIDIAAEKEGLLAIVEVKSRASLALAAEALSARQRARLLQAAEILMAEHPGWGASGVRFDVMLVNPEGDIRRVIDAFRLE